MRLDEATLDKTRIGYARIMVEFNIGQDFPDKIYFKDETGAEVCVCVEYEWKPVVCGSCRGVGHTKEDCRKKVAAPRIIQISRQEHVVASHLSPGKTYLEVVSPPKDKEKSVIEEPEGSGTEHFNGHHWEGVNNNIHHPGGRFWIIWIPQIINVQLITSSDQHITVDVTEIGTGDSFKYNVVYGSNSDIERQRLWAQLNHIKDNNDKAWCLCGDFNSLLNFNERLGSEVLWSEIRDFRQCVEYCGMTDIQAYGSYFTWNNKHSPSTRVFSRIDRCLINIEWSYLYPVSTAFFMNGGIFDHCPCICQRRNTEHKRRPFFKYFNMWSMDPLFTNIIIQEWRKPIAGVRMFQVVSKLKALRKPLKSLNKNKFTDIEKSTEIAKLLLDDLQSQMHSNPHDQNLSKASASYLHQKAKVDWNLGGDENSRYFHSKIKARQIHNKVFQIVDASGSIHQDPQAIEKAFLDYYSHLLGSSSNTVKVHKPTVRTGNCITEHHVNILLRPVTNEEIKLCLFSIPAPKVLVPMATPVSF
ncbi:uncharacterized protein LOC141640517 [Silene latifolia]|uniref:uncharacterized protein LOC141640517 n=1 Tax=Silene latifolia TaxID=37657 RepID=UPI003D77C08C